MNTQAAITVHRARDEVERLWNSPEYRAEHVARSGAAVTFKRAPGERGTEIHVDLAAAHDSGVGGVVAKLKSPGQLAKAKDDLRRFKQRVETGVIPRSEGSPEGELAERKLKQRPAQPLNPAELEKAGVS
jgi:uncharacterized membrane protein